MLSIPFPESEYIIAALGSDLKQCSAVACHGAIQISDSVADMADAVEYATARDHLLQRPEWSGIRSEKKPDIIACDAHPDAMVTLLAEELATELADNFAIPVLRVQHHHAHIASVMAEHDLDHPVIGLALDGFGYGADGESWGGECLLVSAGGSRRLGRLKPLPLPGGDQAARQPWRMAVAALYQSGQMVDQFIEPLWASGLPAHQVLKLCRSERVARSSSAGRYFDAASAIITGITVNHVEAEAAIKLEQLASASDDLACFDYGLEETDGLLQLNLDATFVALAKQRRSGDDAAMLARRFHNTLIEGLAELVIQIAGREGIADVVCSGGCFFNRLLSAGLENRLAGLHVHRNHRLTVGDGNISTGQAWVALQYLKGNS